MAAGQIVPAFGVAEGRHPRLCLRDEPTYSQLAFKRGEEALAHGVVVSVADRSHRWAGAGLATATTQLV